MNNGIEILQVGMLKVAPANAILQEAAAMPDPVDLYKGLWYEGEVACLFADTNVGKSILAVQIAEEIARTQQPVLYFDCELSEKQFQVRYTNKETGKLHPFPKSLYRCSVAIDGNVAFDEKYEDGIIRNLEQAALQVGTKVVIIDNLTFLCLDAVKGEAASQLMMKLIRLKQTHGWSLLVIAHTPKRKEWTPLSRNDLAGSKKLADAFDDIFAIGRCKDGDSNRYIIQLKTRLGECIYPKEKVLRCRQVKDDDYLHFEFGGTASEKSMLYGGVSELLDMQTILDWQKQGLSLRSISDKFRSEGIEVSKSTLQRKLQEYEENVAGASEDLDDEDYDDEDIPEAP